MKAIKSNFRLTRVQGKRVIVSGFNVWGRAYNAFRLASVQGWDYVELVRVRDELVLYQDGDTPSWLNRGQRAPL